jgi:hypothetical protein
MALLVNEIMQRLAPAQTAASVPETSIVAPTERSDEARQTIRRDFSKYGSGTDTIH